MRTFYARPVPLVDLLNAQTESQLPRLPLSQGPPGEFVWGPPPDLNGLAPVSQAAVFKSSISVKQMHSYPPRFRTECY